MAAGQLIKRIIARGEGLVKVPETGRKVPELPGTGIREIIGGNFRMVYRSQMKMGQVLTLFEGHRQFPIGEVDG